MSVMEPTVLPWPHDCLPFPSPEPPGAVGGPGCSSGASIKAPVTAQGHLTYHG